MPEVLIHDLRVSCLLRPGSPESREETECPDDKQMLSCS